MRLGDLNLKKDHVFTHFDEDGTQTTFATDRLRKCAEIAAKFSPYFLVPCPIEDDVAEMIRSCRGVEPDRLRRAMKTEKYKPLLYLNMPDNSQLLVDGTHTYLALHAKGIKEAPAYIIPEIVWRIFVIEDMPAFSSEEEMLNTPSGIKT